MRILEVTFIPPNLTSGGGIGIYQSMKSILGCAEMDYIGPEFDTSLFLDCDNLKSVFLLNQSKRTLHGIVYMLAYGATTSYFEEWNKMKTAIDWSRYDAVHVEMSRYNFVIDEAIKHGLPTIIRLHNIERDYAYAMYRNEKNLAHYLIYKSYSINEKKCIKKANKLVFITREDAEAAIAQYSVSPDRVEINPVCINATDSFSLCGEKCKKADDEGVTFLTTGTLSFGPNSKGVIWLVNNIWNQIAEKCNNAKLIIAGAHPSQELRNVIDGNQSITLVDTPSADAMSQLFRQSDVYLAPIFEGAGMKVKVAEALSYGLTVIGTRHAWIGYDLVQLGRISCDEENEFIDEMLKICNHSIKISDKKYVSESFYRNYSIDASINNYRKIFREFENGDTMR